MKKKLTLLTILLIGLAHGVQAGFFHMPESRFFFKFHKFSALFEKHYVVFLKFTIKYLKIKVKANYII